MHAEIHTSECESTVQSHLRLSAANKTEQDSGGCTHWCSSHARKKQKENSNDSAIPVPVPLHLRDVYTNSGTCQITLSIRISLDCQGKLLISVQARTPCSELVAPMRPRCMRRLAQERLIAQHASVIITGGCSWPASF
mmetsp:Transcript_69260/g.123324  ORF Transcript_69260/g.123324 Transcript_69260/m.123324 type:complete len:138 (-) Transcript_69260:1913-2326(-)